jgi:hypothetical protein
MRTQWGSVRADEVIVGMRLLSRDEYDPEGVVVPQVVEEVFVREGLICLLKVMGQTIRSTNEHPFFVKDKGWTPLNRIVAGDAIWTEASGWVTVDAVEETGQWETVYNFRIADHHTYFVGCDEWGFSVWAHNEYSTNRLQNAAIRRDVEAKLIQIGMPAKEAARLAKLGGAKGTNGQALVDAVNNTGINPGNLYMKIREVGFKATASHIEGLVNPPVTIAKTITISRSKYPQSAKHIEDAQAAGHPSILTIDRDKKRSEMRRYYATKDAPVVKDMQPDEYPPAMFLEGGKGSSWRNIPEADNMGAGSSMGNQARNVKDGSKILLTVGP